MGPSGRIGYIYWTILECLGQVSCRYCNCRAPRTKETLPDFLKWRRVTRHPLVFRGLTGSQRTPGFGGVTHTIVSLQSRKFFMFDLIFSKRISFSSISLSNSLNMLQYLEFKSSRYRSKTDKLKSSDQTFSLTSC